MKRWTVIHAANLDNTPLVWEEFVDSKIYIFGIVITYPYCDTKVHFYKKGGKISCLQDFLQMLSRLAYLF